MEEQFYQWLREQGAYDAFVENSESAPDEMGRWLEEDPEDWMAYAFDWDSSEEGYDYWESLDAAWVRHLELQE